MTSQSQDEHFKNPLVDNGEDRNMMIATAAAKGAGLALVAGGLIAMSGSRYSQTYKTLSRPMKTFLLGSGNIHTFVSINAASQICSFFKQDSQMFVLIRYCRHIRPFR